MIYESEQLTNGSDSWTCTTHEQTSYRERLSNLTNTWTWATHEHRQPFERLAILNISRTGMIYEGKQVWTNNKHGRFMNMNDSQCLNDLRTWPTNSKGLANVNEVNDWRTYRLAIELFTTICHRFYGSLHICVSFTHRCDTSLTLRQFTNAYSLSETTFKSASLS